MTGHTTTSSILLGQALFESLKFTPVTPVQTLAATGNDLLRQLVSPPLPLRIIKKYEQ